MEFNDYIYNLWNKIGYLLRLSCPKILMRNMLVKRLSSSHHPKLLIRPAQLSQVSASELSQRRPIMEI